MDKDETLVDSKEENNNEGTKYAANNSRLFGEIGFYAFFLFITIYNYRKGINNFSLFSIFWAYVSLKSLGIYIVSKNGIGLFIFIVGFLSSILSLVTYILKTM